MLAIVDYEAGNQTSVKRALDFLGIPCRITDNPVELQSAAGIIFPGVGAAGQAMAALKKKNLDVALKDLAASGKPLLGICLGCQILLGRSEEDHTPTLDILPGICRKMHSDWLDESGKPVKIPHMGWNGIKKTRPSRIWHNIPDNAEFYFAHGYYVEPEQSLVLGVTTHGKEFCAAYGREGLWAAQFHPEKSGAPGLQFLKNFFEFTQNQKGFS